MDKIAMLTEILTHNPGDAFARYGWSGIAEQTRQVYEQLLPK